MKECCLIKTDYRPILNKLLEEDKLLHALYKMRIEEDGKEVVEDITDVYMIIDICDYYGIDPIPFLSGEKDIDKGIFYTLILKKMIDEEEIVFQPVTKQPKKKTKKKSNDNVIKFPVKDE